MIYNHKHTVYSVTFVYDEMKLSKHHCSEINGLVIFIQVQSCKVEQ